MAKRKRSNHSRTAPLEVVAQQPQQIPLGAPLTGKSKLHQKAGKKPELAAKTHQTSKVGVRPAAQQKSKAQKPKTGQCVEPAEEKKDRVQTPVSGKAKGGAKKTKKRKAQNALSNAINNMNFNPNLWRKFGYGEILFKAYYTELGIIPTAELEAFMECVRKPLPVTFRLHKDASRHKHCLAALERLRKESLQDGAAPFAMETQLLGEAVYRVTASQRELSQARKGQIRQATLAKLAKLLDTGCAEGAMSRQAIDSMLSVIALGPQPGERVLDMCASPGSKTKQLLERVGNLRTSRVVANDASEQRAAKLLNVMQSHTDDRLGVLEISCMNGQDIACPTFDEAGRAGSGFDRVLADVPCSGDGTIRKEPDILKRWHPSVAFDLHALQIKLAMNALAVLKVGGRMVYSTCSLNPVEDEAVVAEVLRRCNQKSPGSVELEHLGGDSAGDGGDFAAIQAAPGLQTWSVATVVESDSFEDDDDFKLSWHSTYEAAMADKAFLETFRVPPTRSMWPPTDMQVDMSRCRRILPHRFDTGGFFIAKFRKLREVTLR